GRIRVRVIRRRVLAATSRNPKRLDIERRSSNRLDRQVVELWVETLEARRIHVLIALCGKLVTDFPNTHRFSRATEEPCIDLAEDRASADLARTRSGGRRCSNGFR